MATKRLILLAIALLLGILGAALFPVDCLVVKDRYNLFSVIFSVYPVLLGFSVIVIAIVGSLDNALMTLSWQRLAIYHQTYKDKMLRQALLCYVYLLVLLLALFVQTLPDNSLAYYLGCKVMVFLGIVSLCCTLSTPFVLYTLHAEKYELLVLQKGAPPAP